MPVLDDFISPKIGESCVELYKIAKLTETELPPPIIHIYLAGSICRFEETDTDRPFLVDSIEALHELIKENSLTAQPYPIPFLAAQSSGDFSINLGALFPEKKDLVFSQQCYQIARHLGEGLKKTRMIPIFDTLILGLESYVDLLTTYYRYSKQPGLKLTERDYLEFGKLFC